MGLAAKLWNRAVDKVLEEATGHRFNSSRVGPIAGRCMECGAFCEDMMDEWKAGKGHKCPRQAGEGAGA